MKHPDVQRPWSAWSESQTLHLAVAYSNPYRWRTRRELMNDFRRHMAGCPNVVLHVGELAYGDRPHEVTGDPSAPFAEFDLQFRTDCEMFHKENILNAVIAHFPPDWKYGGYSDADFTFTRYDWALEAIHMLQHHPWVQLFSSYTDLSSDHEPYGMARSFAWNYQHQDSFLESRTRWIKTNPAAAATSYHVRQDLDKTQFPFGFDPGAPGGAWAFTKYGLNTPGGLLDVNILGGGDSEMAHGLIGVVQGLAKRVNFQESPRAALDGTASHASAVLEWQQKAQALTQNVGYVKQHVNHHFHGSKLKRQYFSRWAILRKHQFNPYTDITRDWQGIYRWTGNKPRLRDDTRQYLITRYEDDPNLYGTEKPIV